MTHPRIKAVRPIRAKRIYLAHGRCPKCCTKPWLVESKDLKTRCPHIRQWYVPTFTPLGAIDLSDTDALVEQVAQAIGDNLCPEGMDPEELSMFKVTATSVLSSLGLLTPARRREL